MEYLHIRNELNSTEISEDAIDLEEYIGGKGTLYPKYVLLRQ